MTKALLDLPTELLDNIFSYLNWDRKESLFPIKPNVVNASLVNKQFRRVLIPHLFQDVVLRLRWSGGELVEPCLFRLRREHPELARYIRCVFIRTEFEQCAHCAAKGDPTAFTVPSDIIDWMNPSNGSEGFHSAQESCRARIDAIAQRLRASGIEETDASAEDIIRGIRSSSQSRTTANAPSVVPSDGVVCSIRSSSQCRICADALSVVMLCVPASTNTIVFQSLPDDSLHQTRNNFALQVLATTVEMLGSNIRDLTLVSTSAIGMSQREVRRTPGLPATVNDPPLLASEVVGGLKLSRLTLALTEHFNFTGHRTHLSNSSISLWHGASDWIRELNIRNTSSEYTETLRCIKGFQSLQILRFQHTGLYLPRPPIVPGQVRSRAEPQQNTWLVFVIEVRQAMLRTVIELDKVYTFSSHTILPQSALQWIQSEAVPPGILIDADRQERLLQDFESFIPLWAAEDSDRGTQALDSWAKQRSALCDSAMSRRWR